MANRSLVTGVTGSGKSTLEIAFSKIGYKTYDIDRGFAEWRSKTSGEIEEYQPDDKEWISGVFWALKADKLKNELESIEEQAVIVFGSTNDLSQHVGLFNKIILLEYPDEYTLVERLASRPEGEYGKTPHERDAALSYYKEYQESMKQLGARVIDCTLKTDQIVSIIKEEILSE